MPHSSEPLKTIKQKNFLFVFGFLGSSCGSNNMTNVLGGVGSTSMLFLCLVRLLSAVDGRSGVHLCRKGNMRNKMGNMYPRPKAASIFPAAATGAPLTTPLPAQIRTANRRKKFDWIS